MNPRKYCNKIDYNHPSYRYLCIKVITLSFIPITQSLLNLGLDNFVWIVLNSLFFIALKKLTVEVI